mmetsp:Transcript_9737/g.18895  ORF Transcript_9737/g.18895 Transcript_9737/m.18895 type:complete len:303 (-) Transcript_9737:841-1749(-)
MKRRGPGVQVFCASDSSERWGVGEGGENDPSPATAFPRAPRAPRFPSSSSASSKEFQRAEAEEETNGGGGLQRDSRSVRDLVEEATRRRKEMMKEVVLDALPGLWRGEDTEKVPSETRSKLDLAGAVRDGTTVEKEKKKFVKKRWCEPVVINKKLVAVVGDGVRVAPSSLGPHVGNGLFACWDFEKGDIITEYVGNPIDRETAKRLREKGEDSHTVSLSKGLRCLDGLKKVIPGLGAAQFANDGNVVIDGREAPGANAQTTWMDDKRIGDTRVFLKATRRIEKGREILNSYDKGYWLGGQSL